MSEDIQIRPLGPDDLDQVLAVATAVEHAPHWTRGDYEAALRDHASRLCLGVVSREGALAGFTVASQVTSVAEIEFIAVSPDRRRRGIGKALLSATVEALRRRGTTEVLLEVRASNQPAQALYRRAGFAETGRRREYYVDPVEDAILFTLQI